MPIKIYKTPQRSDEQLEYSVNQNILTINGENFDLTGVETTLQINSKFVLGDVFKKDGIVHVQLAIPYSKDDEPVQHEQLPIVPDFRGIEEIKKEANTKVEISHAEFLRSLTGNATIEERDTWQAKALACEAISNGTNSEIQTEMIATEAQIMGEEIETLITKILTRYGAYQKLIGLASGLKRKTQATIDQCTTKEQIDQVLEQSSQQADQYVQQWMQG